MYYRFGTIFVQFYLYECMYYCFGTEFVPKWYKISVPWRETLLPLFAYLLMMNNPADDTLALLKAFNEQIEQQWDEELLPSIMCSLYASVVVLLDDLVDDHPQQHREITELQKSLRLYTRRPRGPRQRTFNHGEARYCIYRDFLGPIPKFPGDQFSHFF